MPSHIREALANLEHDVAALHLAPPHAIRARSQARRRRQIGMAATVAAGVAVTGAVALPPLYRGWGGPDGQPRQVATAPTPSDPANTQTPGGCVSPSASPTLSGSQRASARAGSRKVKVFLKSTAGTAEKAAVEAALRRLNTVTAIEFLSHERQWQRFATQYCYAPDLVAATKPESLPEAFDLTLANPEDYTVVRAAVETLAGVGEVVGSVE